MKNAAFLMLVCCLLAAPLPAQVPNLVNYQGRITVGPINFNGSGQFKFALVSGDGTTAYWSNDGSLNAAPGTLTPNVQPSHAVALTVANGLYSVLLGDTTVSSFMTTIPTSAWTNGDVRLRVWFSDGNNSSQLLTPDQRLAPTAYLASGVTVTGTPNFTGDLNLPATTSASTGVLDIGGAPFLHAYGASGLSSGNTFLGDNAGNFTLSGTLDTASGYQALASDTTGSGNTASGVTALTTNTTGSRNTAAGYQALYGNTTGSNNSAFGNNALLSNTTASQNVALGSYALLNATGNANTALGFQAGFLLTTGSNNIDIGSPGVAGESNVIRLGDGSTQTATYLTGLVNNSGLLTTVSAGADTLGTTSVDSSLGLRLMNSAGSGTFNSPNVTGIAFGQNSTRQAIVGETFGNDGLDFYVSANLTTPVVRIDANGRLGVGTLSPLNTLDVTGFAHTTSGYKTDGTLYVAGTSTLAGNVTLNGVISGNGSGLTGITSTSLASNLTLAGITTLSGDLNLPATTSASTGVLDIGGTPFLHDYGHGGLTDGNTFVGGGAGNFTLTGTGNTASGYQALKANTTGTNNTASGAQALYSNTTGNKNTASGNQALAFNTTGFNNIGIGYLAGIDLTTGSNNIDIGSGGVAGESNIIRLGDGSTQTDTYLTGNVHASTATVSGVLTAGSSSNGVQFNGRLSINTPSGAPSALTAQRFSSSEYAGSFLTENGYGIVNIGTSGYALSVNPGFGLVHRTDNSAYWDVSSDERIKHDIRNVTGALATLERLRPVQFHYNADFLAKSVGSVDYERFGVVAQEFQKVFPDFVDTDKDGLLSIRMDPIPIVTAAAVQELDAADKQRDATVANLQAENVALKKQVAQMQADDKDRDARLARLEKLLPTP